MWFRHDNDADDDQRMECLIDKYGNAGVGIFWRIAQRLHKAGGKLPISHLEVLSRKLGYPELQSYYQDCCAWGLYEADDECFWSRRMLNELEAADMSRCKRAAAGKAGAEAMWKKRLPRQTHGKRKRMVDTEIREEKIRKEEEESRAFGPHVRLTSDEHKTLKAGLGGAELAVYIGKINDYCASKGRRYRNYAAAIRNWARNDGKWREVHSGQGPPSCGKCGHVFAGTEGFCTKCGEERGVTRDKSAVQG